MKKTRSVLLHRLDNRVLDDLDMGGALVFVFVLGGLHLLVSVGQLGYWLLSRTRCSGGSVHLLPCRC